MRIPILLLLVVTTACMDIEETSCFDVDNAPDKGEIVYNERIEVTHDRDPTTLEEAEESMRGYVRDRLKGSSDKVMCLVDEGDALCKEGSLDPDLIYFDCLFSHPLLDEKVPEGVRSEVFFPPKP